VVRTFPLRTTRLAVFDRQDNPTGWAWGRTQMNEPGAVNKQAIHEMEQARASFHLLLGCASSADLKQPSRGTRWNNEQLLFHMLFGYLLVRVLLGLVRVFGRLPDGASRMFARALNAMTGPFHIINYWGSCVGETVFAPARLGRTVDRVIASLHRRLDAEDDAALRRGMHFPVDWDPFFKDFMTFADVYRYPTQHFDFHREQLSLPGAE
jgi:hypothetical protein